MKIKKIHLRNFKNFEDVTVELGDMNVLIGANASGKSNFLSALKFLRDIQQFGMEDAVSLQGGIEYIGRFGMKEGDDIVIGVETKSDVFLRFKDFLLVKEKKILPLVKGIIYELKITVKGTSYSFTEKKTYKTYAFSGTFNDIDEKFNYDSKSFIPYNYTLFSQDSGNIVLDNPYDIVELLNIENDNPIIVADLSPLSNSYNYFADGLLNKLVYPNELSLSNISIYDFDPKLIKQPTSMLSKAKLEENGSNLAVVLKKILANPEKSKSLIRMTKYLLPFVKNVMVEKSLNKSLQFSINESHNAGVNLPNFLLSDGTVTAMATLVGLAYEANKVVIFEEPERGIHPELISSLMGLFYDITTETRKKQVIITTHNPTWLNHAKVEDILIFERNKQGTCEISKVKDRDMVKRFLKKGSMIGHLFAHNLLNS